LLILKSLSSAGATDTKRTDLLFRARTIGTPIKEVLSRRHRNINTLVSSVQLKKMKAIGEEPQGRKATN
jgi:hypothetical protein